MSDGVEIRAISPTQAQHLRFEVLRPEEKVHTIYELDNAPETLHVGAFVGGDLAAIASICPQPMPGSSESGEWRLRGMATLDRFRGRGLGKRLAESCFAHADSEGGSLVWCSARFSAVGFYCSLGFKEVEARPFFLPEYSREPYILMQFSPIRNRMI